MKRPESLIEFTGQDEVIGNLTVFLASAKKQGVALDHVLLSGGPGLGKTTLSKIIAQELGTQLHYIMGPGLQKAGDLYSLLLDRVHEGDVVLIDEIHRLSPVVAESLYGVMEDFEINSVLGREKLQPFT